MEKEIKEIEKPWAVYRNFFGPLGFGKIEEDNNSSVNIRYSEGQMYASECWDVKFVKRFDTLNDAMEYYTKNHRGAGSPNQEFIRNKIKICAQKNFPSYFIQK
ncbi:MAG: hypothetical protein Q7S33_01240 [Nanoarchaeota archaeon]|nr:hypothetical protein [Nanoarchaeota archaeon]